MDYIAHGMSQAAGPGLTQLVSTSAGPQWIVVSHGMTFSMEKEFVQLINTMILQTQQTKQQQATGLEYSRNILLTK